MDCNTPNITSDPLVQTKLLKRKQQKENIYPIIIHYTHEQRFQHYKSMIHKIWNDIFVRTPVTETKLIVGTRNNHNITAELVRRSPQVSDHNNHKNNHHAPQLKPKP